MPGYWATTDTLPTILERRRSPREWDTRVENLAMQAQKIPGLKNGLSVLWNGL